MDTNDFHYERKLRLLRENHYILPNERKYNKSAIFALNSKLKQPVFGLNDGEKIVLYATPNPIKTKYIKEVVKKHVISGISVANESKLYNDWKQETGLELSTNNHHNNQYQSKDGYTSNPIENTFSWYKRGFIGVTHCKYHQLYLNEFVFRYNTRGISHTDRFREALKHTIGRTITYKDIRQQKSIFQTTKKNELSLEEIKSILETGIVSEVIQNHQRYTKESFK